MIIVYIFIYSFKDKNARLHKKHGWGDNPCYVLDKLVLHRITSAVDWSDMTTCWHASTTGTSRTKHREVTRRTIFSL